jgi:hypothetical protein
VVERMTAVSSEAAKQNRNEPNGINMTKKFRAVEAKFEEPAVLDNATYLGELEMKLGSQLLTSSSLAIAVDGEKRTYELGFTVCEDSREDENVTYDVVLVKNLLEFECPHPMLILGDLRDVSNCRGHLLLVSVKGEAFNLFPTLHNATTRIYSKRPSPRT